MSSDSAEPTEPTSHASPEVPCSYVPPEPSRQLIDPDGDLSLQVGETRCINIPGDGDQGPNHEHELPVTFVVCSKTLSRASRVWKTLLYGGFAESKPSCNSSASEWVVNLPDDNPKAMAAILNIIHSRFESLPQTTDLINLDDLYELTVLTDKYDLTTILRPWASIWMNFIRERYKLLGYWMDNNLVTSDLERLLWISWEMGDEDLFICASKLLAYQCSVDDNGDLQNNTGNEIVPLFNSTLEPPGLHDLLKTIRLQTIERMLQIYSDIIHTLLDKTAMSTDRSSCCEERYWDDKLQCEAGILGIVIRSLSWSDFWPLPAATGIKMNVKQLLIVLKAIDVQSPVHSYCRGVPDRYNELIRRSEIQMPISTSQKARMVEQAAKSGYNIYTTIKTKN
ncbi:hypothetical protein F5Y10DRAFT_177310 [Nemania abortiva]|nr:hypothetical protein F5Y10DRAFT_177310 [Nemania abortiva]